MNKLFFQLIKEAQQNLVNNPQNYAHEITHHYRTWVNAKEISSQVNMPFNIDLLELLCWWHDVQVPGLDYKDKRVCHVVADYLAAKVPPEYSEIVLDSIKNHEFGSKPIYTEGKILQDADKLEILSDERFRIAVDAVKAGLMNKDFYNAALEVYNNWLPKMLDMYNFDVSRVLHESRLKELEPKIKQYMTELAQAQ
jgi:HD superfamily phosphodiesterase